MDERQFSADPSNEARRRIDELNAAHGELRERQRRSVHRVDSVINESALGDEHAQLSDSPKDVAPLD